MNVPAALKDKIDDAGYRPAVVDLPFADESQAKCCADLVDLHCYTVCLSTH